MTLTQYSYVSFVETGETHIGGPRKNLGPWAPDCVNRALAVYELLIKNWGPRVPMLTLWKILKTVANS